MAAAAACRPDAPVDVTAPGCALALARGAFLGLRPLLDGGERELGVVYGAGLDARQILDLEALDPAALVVPADAFYLRTAAPDGLGDPAAWAIRLTGRVQAEQTVPIDALLAEVRDIGTLHLECSGNGDSARFGLMSAGRFAGVPVPWLLARAAPAADAVAVRISGWDEHPPSATSTVGAAWVFRPEELAEAWLITHQDDAPIPADHGAPVRLIVPGWYGCTAIKWIDEVAWVGDDEPATSQMREFAARTHQDGVPELARDYAPAQAETSAVPIRVEAWRVDGVVVHRVVGVVWGGRAPPDALRLLADDVDLGPVALCPREHPATWGLWEAFLPVGLGGVVTLRLEADGAPALRLDRAWYARPVDLG